MIIIFFCLLIFYLEIFVNGEIIIGGDGGGRIEDSLLLALLK